MMRNRVAAVIVVLAITVVAWFLPRGAAQPQLFRLADYSGEEIYQRFCASCHGTEGRGDGPVAASLNVVVPDLVTLSQRRGGQFPAAEVREIVDGRADVIAHGPRTMPVWGYEFWIEEGADSGAEMEARDAINRLVGHLAGIQLAEPDPSVPR